MLRPANEGLSGTGWPNASKVARKTLSYDSTDMAFFRSETMKVAVYSTKHYDQKSIYLKILNKDSLVSTWVRFSQRASTYKLLSLC